MIWSSFVTPSRANSSGQPSQGLKKNKKKEKKKKKEKEKEKEGML
jgi:hypothetical protein